MSGTMTLYVLDANRAEQVGVRLGFDASDALEYYVFLGHGEWLGQIAQFEPFGDVGLDVALGNRQVPQAKGGRPVYRPTKTNPAMSKPDLEAAIAKTTSVFAEKNPMAGNKLPVSEFLKGKEPTLRYDSWLALDYRFDEVQKLRWRREGETAWHEERTSPGSRARRRCSAIDERRARPRRVLDRDGLRSGARNVSARHDGHAALMNEVAVKTASA
jgi:hypothetical protein